MSMLKTIRENLSGMHIEGFNYVLLDEDFKVLHSESDRPCFGGLQHRFDGEGEYKMDGSSLDWDDDVEETLCHAAGECVDLSPSWLAFRYDEECSSYVTLTEERKQFIKWLVQESNFSSCFPVKDLRLVIKLDWQVVDCSHPSAEEMIIAACLLRGALWMQVFRLDLWKKLVDGGMEPHLALCVGKYQNSNPTYVWLNDYKASDVFCIPSFYLEDGKVVPTPSAKKFMEGTLYEETNSFKQLPYYSPAFMKYEEYRDGSVQVKDLLASLEKENK